MATAYLALVFTGLVALSVVGSFGWQAHHMWKTKNFRFLHKDLFTLFLVGSLLLSVALVAGKETILKSLNGVSNVAWLCEPVRWVWVGFSVFMSIVCLGLLSFSIIDNGKSLSLSDRSDAISDIHSYGSSEDEFKTAELIEGGEIPSNLQGNI